MPIDRKREVRDAIASVAPDVHVLVFDARTGRAVAQRPGAEGAAVVMVSVGQADMEDLRRMGGSGYPSIRPNNSSGSRGEPEADELGFLTPAARREVKSHRNRHGHAVRAAMTTRGATSAAHGADGSNSRPSASDQAPDAPTRPDSGPGSVRGI